MSYLWVNFFFVLKNTCFKNFFKKKKKNCTVPNIESSFLAYMVEMYRFLWWNGSMPVCLIISHWLITFTEFIGRSEGQCFSPFVHLSEWQHTGREKNNKVDCGYNSVNSCLLIIYIQHVYLVSLWCDTDYLIIYLDI